MTHRSVYIMTLVLIIISMALGAVGIFASKNGYGELYPFFSWRLYSKPLGAEGGVSQYRIYGLSAGATDFTRIRIADTPTFSATDYVYTLEFLARQYQGDTTKASALRIFCKHCHPEYQAYRLVKEEYDIPQAKQDLQLKKMTVYEFKVNE
jgi:hypothetical protein